MTELSVIRLNRDGPEGAGLTFWGHLETENIVAGFSGGGPFEMTRRCEAQFGLGSRVCKLDETIETLQPPSFSGLAWVNKSNPVIATGECGKWAGLGSPPDERGGTISFLGNRTNAPCADELPVACCGWVEIPN